MPDIEKIADDIFAAIKGYVAGHVRDLARRFAEMETKLSAIPAGPKGDAGERGEAGAAGAPGRDGADGKDGADGSPGAQGARGEAGEKGDTGTQGEPGVAGFNGQDGAPGPRGEAGPQGEAGSIGPAGAQGMAGDRGADGAPGRDGVDGRAGDPGQPGEPGQMGEAGARGERGDAGAAGAAGRDGLDGADGPAGPQGKSAYAVALDSGFVGTEAQWLLSLRGAPGQDGAAGPRGEPGMDGQPGAAGARGEAGDLGKDGKDGRDGRDGKDGDAGRDALELNVLSAIDESKSYPRGTFAEYRGGLIRALRATDPVEGGLEDAGWSVVLNGIHQETEEMRDDGRTINRVTVYTNGRSLVRDIKSRVLLYREVWRDGTYEPGDVVTWAGSAWHCQQETEDKPDTGSVAWKLMVKRGQNGKDGAPAAAPAAQVRLK